jgi:hypothetical protein
LLNLITEWLKQKENYVSYRSEVDNALTFQNKIADMLFHARVHFDNLKASDCYIVQTISNKFDYFYEHPGHYRHNFYNFNIKRNEYVYDKANMNEAAKNFTVDDTTRNRAIVLSLLNELKHGYFSKNKFLEKFDRYPYKDIFFDTNENTVEQIKNDAEARLRQNEFSFEDFKSAYVDKIKEESRGLQEIGIFYPFVVNHDIFEDVHYLFEINHLKFQKDNKNISDIVNNFYKGYGVNCDKSKDIFNLEKYFTHPGFGYSKEFAYFNPYENYEKYKYEYKQIKDNIVLKKLKFKDFIFELFEALNRAQVGIIKFQHENLIGTLITTRSKNRQYSIRELIEIQIKKVENDELPIQGFDQQLYRSILHAFKYQSSNFIFTKNTKIDDMEVFARFPDYFRQNAKLVLDDILSVLNKDDSSKLQYIYDHYMEKLNIIAKKYKLNLENKHITHDMLLDLVFFYKDKSKEKLSKPFNSTMEKIYQKNQNRNIEKIIDFDFQTKFKQQYDDHFNMYKPHEIKTENGERKYMMFM